MAEGTAIRDLEEPERILIGSEDTPQGFAAATSLQALYENWVMLLVDLSHVLGPFAEDH
jgi:UDPglucose 6-dehydrogenase